MTIVEAIKQVMRTKGKPMTATEVYDAIMDAGLYTFNADNPAHIVRSQIRRHCQGLDFPSASTTKHFTMLQDGSYFVLPKAITVRPAASSPGLASRGNSLLDNLRSLHKKYLEDFRRRTLENIKKLDPTSFELFGKKLLEAYGFRDMCVTRPSKDGGIDGYGKLKVGLAHLNVAFQCKRWKKGTVGRPDVAQFRGDIQGQFEQGMFFTTASFSPDAQSISFKPGAVPIVLIDGPAILDLMIEKGFGVETESLPIHSYALDLVISDSETGKEGSGHSAI